MTSKTSNVDWLQFQLKWSGGEGEDMKSRMQNIYKERGKPCFRQPQIPTAPKQEEWTEEPPKKKRKCDLYKANQQVKQENDKQQQASAAHHWDRSKHLQPP